jgi:hypothetical protein
MSIDSAIARIEAELAEAGLGTLQAPELGTEAWFLLRARALGASFLKQVRQDGISGDPAEVEKAYRNASRLAKHKEK